MKGVIEYRLEDGTAVYVETQEPQKGSGMDRWNNTKEPAKLPSETPPA